MRSLSLPYLDNNMPYIDALSSLQHFVFLDSCGSSTDIVSALPDEVFCAWHSHEVDPTLFAMEKALAEDRYLLGYFSYAVNHHHYDLEVTDSTMPLLWFGGYPWTLSINHQQSSVTLSAHHGTLPEKIVTLLQSVQPGNDQPPANKPPQMNHPWVSSCDKPHYQQAWQQIQTHLLQGDCYQVNYTYREHKTYTADPWQLYQHLRQAHPAPYAAYLHINAQIQVLSLSPELLLKREGQQITTQPIKGTIARKQDPISDQQQIKALRDSGKDQSENMMIADLMRHDFAKISQSGSVKVTALNAVLSLTTLHHLVTTITATLKPEVSWHQIIQALLPAGSITGAPKKRVMSIIDTLEDTPRQVYCGNIGYLYQQEAKLSVAIRTLYKIEDQLMIHAGSGITVQSTCDEEYDECALKIAKLKALVDDPT